MFSSDSGWLFDTRLERNLANKIRWHQLNAAEQWRHSVYNKKRRRKERALQCQHEAQRHNRLAREILGVAEDDFG